MEEPGAVEADPDAIAARLNAPHVGAEYRVVLYEQDPDARLLEGRRGGEPLTMGDALAELLADITEAARTIGTMLQTANGRS